MSVAGIPDPVITLVWTASYLVILAAGVVLVAAMMFQDAFDFSDRGEDMLVALTVVFFTGAFNRGIWPVGAVVGIIIIRMCLSVFNLDQPGSRQVDKTPPVHHEDIGQSAAQPVESPLIPRTSEVTEDDIPTPSYDHEIWPPEDVFHDTDRQ